MYLSLTVAMQEKVMICDICITPTDLWF